MSHEEFERDPREELRELGTALRRHVQRRSRFGERRVAVERASEPIAAAPAVAPTPLAVPPPAARAPAPAPVAAKPSIPPPPPPPLFRELASRPNFPAPPPPPSMPAPKSPIQRQADEIRARAAACADLESLRGAVAECTACVLCKTRTQTVFSDGSGAARVMFVGEAPGENEDKQGVPFVGRAGQLLTDIIEKGMGIPRAQVYIANVLKCRPPENRDPTDAEKTLCTPFLDRQIELVDPLVIIPLGRHAANHVLGLDGTRALTMGALRGRVHERGSRKVVPTYHPAYLLRSPGEKKECWKDIQLAMGLLGLKPLRERGGGT